MTMKKIILFLFLFLILPSQAGVYEDALSRNNDVLLYIYTPTCRSCMSFTPIYNDVIKQHPNLKGVMVNAETAYGFQLLQKFKGRYVPYVVLANGKKNKAVTIDASCVANSICFERAQKSFK